MSARLVVALLFVLSLVACGDGASSSSTLSVLKPDRMAGCYALKRGGRAEIKISKRSGSFYAALRQGSKWNESNTPLIPASEKDLKKLFGDTASQVAESLVAQDGPFGIFRLKSDSSIKGKDPSSDYLALVFIGAGAAFSENCD